MTAHDKKPILFAIILLFILLLILLVFYAMLENLAEIKQNSSRPATSTLAETNSEDMNQETEDSTSGIIVPEPSPVMSDPSIDSTEMTTENSSETSAFSAPIFYN